MSELKVDTLTGKTTAKTVTVTVGASATQSLERVWQKHMCYTTWLGLRSLQMALVTL